MPTRATRAIITPAAQIPPASPAAPPPPPPLVPVAPRRDGWSAARQRGFLTALAECGSVTTAAAEVGVSARSAYRLRARADAAAFAEAWDDALRIAAGRLTAIAFERATTGRVKQFWKHGELVATTREPSDRLLMFLLDTLYDRGHAGSRASQLERFAGASRTNLPACLDRLTDNACHTEFIQAEDFYGAPVNAPADEDEPDV